MDVIWLIVRTVLILGVCYFVLVFVSSLLVSLLEMLEESLEDYCDWYDLHFHSWWCFAIVICGAFLSFGDRWIEWEFLTYTVVGICVMDWIGYAVMISPVVYIIAKGGLQGIPILLIKVISIPIDIIYFIIALFCALIGGEALWRSSKKADSDDTGYYIPSNYKGGATVRQPTYTIEVDGEIRRTYSEPDITPSFSEDGHVYHREGNSDRYSSE